MDHIVHILSNILTAIEDKKSFDTILNNMLNQINQINCTNDQSMDTSKYAQNMFTKSCIRDKKVYSIFRKGKVMESPSKSIPDSNLDMQPGWPGKGTASVVGTRRVGKAFP